MRFLNLQRLFCIVLIISILYVSCAKIEPPPGGPIDKTGPSIISTIPAAGATGAPKDNKIAITFSESVDHRLAEAAIFISPCTHDNIDYRWKGKTLNIVLPDSFADSATYVVSIGTGVSDLRNNKMDKSYLFAFSTGETINQGQISGATYQGNKPVANISVAIFDSSNHAQKPYLDSVYPAYLTQAGQKGEYALQFLADGDYLLFAFDDKNKNQLFDYPDEDFGVPDRLARVSSEEFPNLNFIMQKEETAAVSIISAGPTVDHLIKVRFSRPVIGDKIIANLEKIILAKDDSTGSIINPRSVLEREEDTVPSFNIFFGDLPDGSYRLKIDKLIFSDRVDTILYLESTVFKIKNESDKNPPSVISMSHSGKTIFPDEKQIKISFSEPIDKRIAGDSLTTIFVKDGDTVRTTSRWLDDFKLDITPDNLEWGKSYMVSLQQNLLVDLAGNKGVDSARMFSFKTYDRDSLGSISGSIAFSGDIDTTGLLYLNFCLLDEAKQFLKPVAGESFSFQLPPGKYLLSGFIDKNGNGSQDLGRLNPFEFSETVSNYPDTIRVRSRFETSGIEFIFK